MTDPMEPMEAILDLSELPYRLKCACGSILVASDNPIPIEISQQLVRVPCTKCVSPDDFLKQVAEQNTNQNTTEEN